MVAQSEPLIFEIKGNSLDDGPGIRTVIFCKGCPLSCLWCHNPESKRREREISFDAGKCVACDACRQACPRAALDRDAPGRVDRARCDLCGRCVEVCPSGALALIGRQLSVEQIAREVERDIPFFRNSGGGVTLSGGEPTLFLEFSAALAAALREKGVHVLLETCGLFNYAAFSQRLYPHLDAIYFDLKLFDAALHRELCGVPNDTILDNFKQLFRRQQQGGIPVLPRIPLIPGLTAVEENLSAIAAFLREQGCLRVALLQNNPLWFDKSRMIGSEPRVPDSGMRGWIDRERMSAIRKLFDGFDIR